MREVTGAGLRAIANRAGSGRVSPLQGHEMRSALYDAAAQLDRCAEGLAENARLRRALERIATVQIVAPTFAEKADAASEIARAALNGVPE